MLTEQNKPATITHQRINIDKLWNDQFPPLNLWNYPSKWIKEIFYKNQGS